MTAVSSAPKPAVFITGASTGIGYACAEALAQSGFHVFVGVRKPEDAARLTQALGDAATPLMCDVTDATSPAAAAQQVRTALGGRTLAGLVNNAGVGSAGPLLHVPLDEVSRVLDVNLMGVIRTTQAFAPLLGADKSLEGPPGRIVMMSSVAGKLAMPLGGVYTASKHALEGLSVSLRRELMMYGIDVIVIGPGAVATPIWDKGESLDLAVYRGTDYQPIIERLGPSMLARGRAGLPASAVGRLVRRVLTVRRPRVRYAISPHPVMSWWLPRMLPARLLDGLVARALGFKPAPTS
jgi:NAD(P)-dependent dehydrogenase (short-subunit alcohol dehydrogenase family)